MEHEIKLERVVDSIIKHREAGKDLGGRSRLITDSQIRNARRLIDGGETPTTVARDLEIPRATFYRRTRALDLTAE
jgi:DNA invertase Pin-like site-specific DNA recombinase